MKIENDGALEHAYSLIKKYSLDSMHYLSLKKENCFLFGEKTTSVISCTLSRKIAMSIGDPVCKVEDLEAFMDEYLNFCKKMKWKPIFNSVSEPLAVILKKRKYIVLKYGEEAILNLPEYTLSGGKRAVLRHNVSKVERSGVILMEYCPKNERNISLETKIEALSRQWYDNKGYEMGYSVGGLDFDQPFDRRFFVTMDEEGELLTFLSFLPYNEGNGFCIDMMCRKIDSMTGVMEHAIVSVAMKMKDEGIKELSLGIAPLAGIDIENPDTNRAEKLLHSIFENMDYGYNFKNLYRFKKKFAPTQWKTRYLVFHPGIIPVRAVLSVVKARNGSFNRDFYIRYTIFILADLLGLSHRLKKKE